jgi:hypothetical protein
MHPPREKLSAERISDLVEYYPRTGLFTWKARADVARNWNTRHAGRPALISVDGKGYLFGRIDYHMYRAHRVAWAAYYGEWPVNFIDHVDGDRKNNKIDNLRDVTHEQNCRNSAMRYTNTSGRIGISFDRRSSKWYAYIRVGGKMKNLGVFKARDDAIAARERAELEFGYHPNHGRLISTRSRLC